MTTTEDIIMQDFLLDIQNGYRKSVERRLSEMSKEEKTPEKLGYLLHVAAQYGQDKIVADLIKAGANVNYRATEEYGDFAKRGTPLMVAAYSLTEDAKEIAEILIKNGANINVQDTAGWSALHAVMLRPETNNDIAFLLLSQKNININAQTDKGHTPLDILYTRYDSYDDMPKEVKKLHDKMIKMGAKRGHELDGRSEPYPPYYEDERKTEENEGPVVPQKNQDIEKLDTENTPPSRINSLLNSLETAGTRFHDDQIDIQKIHQNNNQSGK